MIVIGSEAARLRNCLPDWREGAEPNDIDIVGTEAEFDALVDHFRAAGKYVVAHDRGGGMKAIRATEKPGDKTRILIDFAMMEHASSTILDQLDDHAPGELFGQPVRVCSPLTQYVLKRAYARLPFQSEKNDRDIAYWRDLVAREGLTLTPDHVALFKAVRAQWRAKILV